MAAMASASNGMHIVCIIGSGVWRCARILCKYVHMITCVFVCSLAPCSESFKKMYGKVIKNLEYRGVKIDLPYLPELIDYSKECQGIKVRGGLFTPCHTHVKDRIFCKPCQKKQDDGDADGTLTEREMTPIGEFVSQRTGKKEISFATYLGKRDITIDEFNVFLRDKFGPVFQIPDHPAYTKADSKKVARSKAKTSKTPKISSAPSASSTTTVSTSSSIPYPDGVYDEVCEEEGIIIFKLGGFRYVRDPEADVFILDDEDDPVETAGVWDPVKKTIIFNKDFDPYAWVSPVPMSTPTPSDADKASERSPPIDFEPGEGLIRVSYQNLKLAYAPSTNFLFRFYDDTDKERPLFTRNNRVMVGMWDPEKGEPSSIVDMDDEDDMYVYLTHEGKRYAYELDEFQLYELDDDVVKFEDADPSQYKKVGIWQCSTNEPLTNIDELTEVEYQGTKLYHNKLKNLYNITKHGCKHFIGIWNSAKGEPELLDDNWDVVVHTSVHNGVEFHYDTYDNMLYIEKEDADGGIEYIGVWDTETNTPWFDEPLEECD